MVINRKINRLFKELIPVVLFSIAGYCVLLGQCIAVGDELCYMHPYAWLYIPAMLMVPGFIVLMTALPLRRKIYSLTIIGYPLLILLHIALAIILLRMWLMITGQEWWYWPQLDGDLPVLVGGGIMGLAVLLFYADSNKLLNSTPKNGAN